MLRSAILLLILLSNSASAQTDDEIDIAYGTCRQYRATPAEIVETNSRWKKGYEICTETESKWVEVVKHRQPPLDNKTLQPLLDHLREIQERNKPKR